MLPTLKKLLLEYKFLLNELEYIKLTINNNTLEFNNTINELLKNNIETNSYIEDTSSITINLNNLTNKEIINKDEITKFLYKQIVKLTHPDIIQNKYLNNIYIKCTEYYHMNDKFYLMEQSILMDIEFLIKQEYIDELTEEIKVLKNKIIFSKKNIMWGWNSTSDKNKNKIILDYIKKEYISKI